MKRIIAVLLCAVMVFALCACGSEKELTEGAVIEDKMLVVYLRGNPTTGYTWTVSGEGDSALGSAGEYEFIADSTGKDATGVGGMFKFKFGAMQNGTQTLHFVYERTFEENSAARAYDVTAEVSGDTITVTKQGEAVVAAPSPSPTPTATPSPSPTPTAAPTASPSPTPTAAPRPTAVPTPTPTMPVYTPAPTNAPLPSPEVSNVVYASGLVVEFGFSLHIRTDSGADLYLTPSESAFSGGYYPQSGDYVNFAYTTGDEVLTSITYVGTITNEAA